MSEREEYLAEINKVRSAYDMRGVEIVLHKESGGLRVSAFPEMHLHEMLGFFAQAQSVLIDVRSRQMGAEITALQTEVERLRGELEHAAMRFDMLEQPFIAARIRDILESEIEDV